MDWIKHYQLFLFDLDGLLVNTEHIHFQAYVNFLAKRGYQAPWNFHQYLEFAHLGGDAIQEAIYNTFPDLQTKEPNWNNLYQEKKGEYLKLLGSGKIELMPGAKSLLEALAESKIKRCVVTNSFREQIEVICSYQPVLKTIPHWVTRDQYLNTKPNPECYFRAIELYGQKGDRIIGFEDSIRGLKALLKTPAVPVLVCEPHYPHLNAILDEHPGIHHFHFLDQVANI